MTWRRSAARISSLLTRKALPLPARRSSHTFGEYSLISEGVDVKLARALYRNNDVRYKLGAGFSRPAINIPVGFMEIPFFNVGEGDAQESADRLRAGWSGSILTIHQALLRDGEVLARVLPGNRSPAYSALFGDPKDNVPELTYVPAEAFEMLTEPTDLGAVTAFRIKHLVIVEEAGKAVERYIVETVDANQTELLYWDKRKETFPNELGFVPAVCLQNENSTNELHGRSELEPLEPYMRFYHDVMLHAGSASALHSTAKLTIRVRDLDRFLQSNFTDAEIADGRLRFRDKDVLFFDAGEPDLSGMGQGHAEGAEIIQAQAPLGDTNTLLEYIFLNIVDVSEVPEWAFGGAIASSKASVTEQSAPLIHKVKRKRTSVENAWALAARMGLRMMDISARVEIGWDELAQKDNKAEAEALLAKVQALVELVDAELISRHSAVESLRAMLSEILPYTIALDGAVTESALIAREAAERAQNALDDLDEDSEEMEENDRQAGIRAVG